MASSGTQKQNVLDTTATGIELLNAVYKGSKIVDFEIAWINAAARKQHDHFPVAGMPLAGSLRNYANRLEKMIEVVEKGTSFEALISMSKNGNTFHYNEKFDRFGQGIIISREEIKGAVNPGLATTASAPDGVGIYEHIFQKDISLQNFKRIADSSHDALISMDTNGIINYWNPAAEKMFLFTADEVRGHTLDQFIIPEEKIPVLRQALTGVYTEGKSYLDIVSHKKDKQGRLIDVLVNIYPLRDEKGVVTGSCVSIKDVTDQKRAEVRAKEDTHLISQIVETTPDIIYIMDLDTHLVTYANRQIAVDLGYNKSQVAAMRNPIFELLVEEDVPVMLEHLKKMKVVSSDNKVLEVQYRLKNAKGGVNWFCDRNSVFKRNERKIPIEKIGICQDITQRKQEEERIRTTMGIIQQSEQVVSMGSWEYDILTDEFKWSDGMYRLFNLEKQIPVRPEIYLEYTSPKEVPVVNEIVDKILFNHNSFEEVITVQPRGGERKLIRIKAVVQHDKDGHPVKLIGVDLDITQQVKDTEEINKLYNKLLQKNDELRSLDEEIKAFNLVAAKVYKETLQHLYTNLEYIVSHDARNLSDSGRANIRRAQSAIQRMNLITDDINAYFALYDHQPQISYVNVNDLLQQVIESYAARLEQHDATIETTPIPELPVDPRLFVKLISNLIGYAIRNRNLVNPLVIKIQYAQADEMNAISAAHKNMAYGIVSLSHNGLGFSDEEAETVFDLFNAFPEKSKHTGPGVSLAICKKIMAMHGGFITAEGQLAKHALFSCYFPLHTD